mgnify:CR=1 FL=1
MTWITSEGDSLEEHRHARDVGCRVVDWNCVFQTSLPLTGEVDAIIASSGSYKLIKAVDRVKIQASNVTLDLNGFTVNKNINIQAYSNIVVKNGFVLGIGVSEAITSIANKNVIISNLEINSASNGVYVGAEVSNTSENIVIRETNIATPANRYGVHIKHAKAVIIDNVNIVAPSGSISSGISLEGEGSVVRDCMIQGHQYGIGHGTKGRLNSISGTTFYDVPTPISNSEIVSNGNAFFRFVSYFYSPLSPNTNAGQN